MERALAEHLVHVPAFVRRMDGEIVYWTLGAQELYGFTEDEAIGRNSHELLATVFPRPLPEIEAELQRTSAWQGLLRHTRTDGASLWTESTWRLRGSDGHRLVVEVNTDVTGRELIARELNHRVRNNLAVIQGIARLSFRNSSQADVRRFEARLTALSKAHDLLMRGHWTDAELREVASAAIEPFGVADRVTLTGPSVLLRPNSVVAYALAFHELTTNALKHGALSTGAGRVELAWEVYGERGERVHLVWTERGGPPVKAPERVGFGSELIQRAVASELGTPVQLRFEPEGLVCEFDGPTQKTPALPGQAPLLE